MVIIYIIHFLFISLKLLNCLKSKIITLIGYYNDNDIDNDSITIY